MPTRSWHPGIGLAATMSVLSACSGTDPVAVHDPVPEVSLDYSKIAGEWRGTVTEIRTHLVYPVAITIFPRAPKGAEVGTVTYVTPYGECTGVLVADAASEQRYALEEYNRSGPCVTRVAIDLMPLARGDSLEYVAMNVTTRVPCCNATLGRPR